MPTATFVSDAGTIPYTPGSAVADGDVIVIGSIVAVATEPIAANVEGAVATEGVFLFPKATTSTSALAAGTKVYWDASAVTVTTTAGSNKVAGYVHEAATAAASTVRVELARA